MSNGTHIYPVTAVYPIPNRRRRQGTATGKGFIGSVITAGTLRRPAPALRGRRQPGVQAQRFVVGDGFTFSSESSRSLPATAAPMTATVLDFFVIWAVVLHGRDVTVE